MFFEHWCSTKKRVEISGRPVSQKLAGLQVFEGDANRAFKSRRTDRVYHMLNKLHENVARF